ncbi:MAG TPA: class II aldolase/adducin family protein [Chloroflexota bacterium]|nr:class II aldolase/adducin family protein [Chloroflexota bacterium]
MTSAEEEAREKLAQCARALARIDCLGLGGHVSLRIPKSDLILITPGGGLDKTRLRAGDMSVMDATGKHVGGPYPPPLEWPIHTAVHAARPELDSVAHLHPHWSTIFGVLDRPMDAVLLGAARLGDRIPWFEVPKLVTSPALGEELRAALADAPAVLMRWHGSTVVGDTIEEMFERARVIEDNARLLWEASLIGKVVPVPRSIGGPQVRGASRTLGYYANLERPTDDQQWIGTERLEP